MYVRGPAGDGAARVQAEADRDPSDRGKRSQETAKTVGTPVLSRAAVAVPGGCWAVMVLCAGCLKEPGHSMP